MSSELIAAKERLDEIINKGRVDLYKPIQIAEVLHRSRTIGDIDSSIQETFQNPSWRWRDLVTRRLLGKVSSSSARYQHDLWSITAMPPAFLKMLDSENTANGGAVERYIYMKFAERQSTVTAIISAVDASSPEDFELNNLLDMFIRNKGIRRSIDKAYEIVTHSLLEVIVNALGITVTVSVPAISKDLLAEFEDLTWLLLGIDRNNLTWTTAAHIYRVGVTNAADRGLDMWANFGAAVQVKHLTLNADLARTITDQVESDNIVIVCRDAEAEVIHTITTQIGWGKRVRGIIRQSELVEWYGLCLRGKFANVLAKPLMDQLSAGFRAEFPQASEIVEFITERGYNGISVPQLWQVEADKITEK